MKKITILFVLVLSLILFVNLTINNKSHISTTKTELQTTTKSDCPPQGDSDRQKLLELDKLKNRQEKKTYIDESLDIKSFMKPGDDKNRFALEANHYLENTLKKANHELKDNAIKYISEKLGGYAKKINNASHEYLNNKIIHNENVHHKISQ